jgi:uncharacterized membrane protein
VAARVMVRMASCVLVLCVGAAARVQATEPPPLVCYGNEPAWRLDLGGAEARLVASGEEEKAYAGRYTSLDPLKVHAWRGRPAPGTEGEIVSILTEESCNDGMSDQRRPYAARISLPDGRLLAGCCRLATVWSATEANRKGQAPAAAAAPPPAAPTGAAPAAAPDWASALGSFLPALRICTFEALRTEAVLFAEQRPDHSVHMVLRLPGKVYADCDVNPAGTVKLNRRSKDKPLLPQEQAAVLTLFPGAPPREPCYKSDHAVDSEGNPFGWISRKGC